MWLATATKVADIASLEHGAPELFGKRGKSLWNPSPIDVLREGLAKKREVVTQRAHRATRRGLVEASADMDPGHAIRSQVRFASRQAPGHAGWC